MRLADLIPLATEKDLAPDRTSGILNHGQTVPSSDIQNCSHIARHADLVNRHYRFSPRRDREFRECRVHVEGTGINIDEDWRRTAVADCICSRDKRMAYRHNFVAWAYPESVEG